MAAVFVLRAVCIACILALSESALALTSFLKACTELSSESNLLFIRATIEFKELIEAVSESKEATIWDNLIECICTLADSLSAFVIIPAKVVFAFNEVEKPPTVTKPSESVAAFLLLLISIFLLATQASLCPLYWKLGLEPNVNNASLSTIVIPALL